MKKYLAGFLMALATLFAASAWSHHAAEGIISDDLWYMIDEMLVEADSPHLYLDLPILDEDSMGQPTLYTTIGFENEEDAWDLIDAIDEELADWENRERGLSTVTVSDPYLTEDDVWEIVIAEPIGSGESQTAEPPEEAPGQQGSPD